MTGEDLTAEAALELVEAGLEVRDIPLQLLDAPLQHFAAAYLVSQETLDPPEYLEDGVIFLLQDLETPVDLVEMAKDLTESLVDMLLEPVKSPVDRRELATEEFDQLLIFATGHGLPRLAHLGGQFKCLHSWTPGGYFLASWRGTSTPGAPLTDRPSTVTKRASFPSAWGEKKRTTSPSWKVSPEAPKPWA